MDGAMRVNGGLLVAFVTLAVLISAAIALAENEPPTPTISGEPRVGEVLTASEADLYKWQRCNPALSPCANGAGQNDSGWMNVLTNQESDARTYRVTIADVGMLIRVLAKDTNLGTKFAASDPVGPVVPAAEEPPSAESSPPAFGQTGDLKPIAGTVAAKPPGLDRWVEITELTQVPLGTAVDVSNGRVQLITQRRPAGRLQSIQLWAGAFVMTQNRKRKITVVRLAHSRPGANGSHELAQTAGHRKRRLWGRGKCRCRHRGRNSSGTARGTWWVTAELPKGTLTRVKQGSVLVEDFKRGKKVLVKKGQRYLARR